MELRNTSILLLILAVLFVLLFPVLFIPNMHDHAEDQSGDDLLHTGCTFLEAFLLPVHTVHVVLQSGVMIFALYLVYLGGRSKHKRFNDRTIDEIHMATIDFVKTALFRAVFNFLSCPILYKRMRYLPCFPTQFPIYRR